MLSETRLRILSLGLILSIALLALTVGCSSPKSQITGKWQRVNSTEVWQFYGDGTYEADAGGIFGVKFRGSYTFPDAQHLRLMPTSSLLQ